MSIPATTPPHVAAFASLLEDAASVCASMLARVTGTHALLLDAVDGPPPPPLPGLGRWTTLHLGPTGALDGELRGTAAALPFADESFCVVLIRHAAGSGLAPLPLAEEAARVLAPHGLLLLVEMHPWSAWRPWLDARRRHGDVAPRCIPPRRWQHALRDAVLAVGKVHRCGAPWPRAQGTRTLPRWTNRCGGGYLLEARKRNRVGSALRLQPARKRARVEHAPLAPGAHRVRG